MDFVPYDDVHELTMGMFRARVVRLLSSFGINAPNEVIELLAGLINLSAHERVLDEAAIRELPDPEHPAVRNLRDQLRHTQAAVDTLAVLPARLFDSISGQMHTQEKAPVAKFVEQLRSAGRAMMLYAGSTATTEATRLTYDEIIDYLIERIESMAKDDTKTTAAARSELFTLLLRVQSSRAALFRDSAMLETSEHVCQDEHRQAAGAHHPPTSRCATCATSAPRPQGEPRQRP